MPSNTAAIRWSPKIKEAFFDRRGVEAALEKRVHKTLFWFGGRVREKTRSYIGSPNIAGSKYTSKSGEEKTVKARKPRPPGKPPIARVRDGALSLRNIQYHAELRSIGNDFWGEVFIHGIKFKSKSSNLSAPEIHEFGGYAKANARLVTERTKAGKPRKRKGKTAKRLIFSRKFSPMIFRIPARPYLGPTFKKITKEFQKRLAENRL